MSNIYEDIAAERLKEVEFWKRKYHELKQEGGGDAVSRQTICHMFQILVGEFYIRPRDEKNEEKVEAAISHLDQIVVNNKLGSDIIRSIREYRLNSMTLNRSTDYISSTLLKHFSAVKSDVEILANVQRQNKSITALFEQVNDLKRKYSDIIKETVNAPRKFDKFRNEDDLVTLLEEHMKQINMFNSLLTEENNRYQGFITEWSSDPRYERSSTLLTRLGELEKVFYDLLALKSVPSTVGADVMAEMSSELREMRLRNQVSLLGSRERCPTARV